MASHAGRADAEIPTASWWAQAESAIAAAEALATAGLYHWACFCAHQAAELALKALLVHWNRTDLLEHHSLADLIRHVARRRPAFRPLRGAAKALDWHYLKARYPQARYRWQSPAELYNRKDYDVCIGYARQIADACKAVLSGEGGSPTE